MEKDYLCMLRENVDKREIWRYKSVVLDIEHALTGTLRNPGWRLKNYYMQMIKTFNEVLAFLLELALFAIICYWGYRLGKSTFSKYVFAVLFVLIAIGLWGVFAAPKSEYRLGFYFRLLFELGMFFTGTYILYGLKHTSLALYFGVLSFMSVLIAFIYRQ